MFIKRKIAASFTATIFLVCMHAVECSISNAAKSQFEDYAPKPVLYCEGKTLAEVIYDDNGNMVHCTLHEVE